MKILFVTIALLLQLNCVLTQDWYSYLSNMHLYDCTNHHDYYLYKDGTYLDEWSGVWPTSTEKKQRRGDWALYKPDEPLTTLILQDAECTKKTLYLGIFPPLSDVEDCPMEVQGFAITVSDTVELNMWMKCASYEKEDAVGVLKVAKGDTCGGDDCTWGQWTISNL